MSTLHNHLLNSRLTELDGIRGIAVLMVVLYHTLFWSMGGGWSGLPKLICKITQPGWLGVDLFFVLSGYLISSILFETKDHHNYFRNFYGRRSH